MSGELWGDTTQERDWPIHGCGGDYCQVCANERKRRGTAAALVYAEDWLLLANRWFSRLPSGATFTSEDMTAEVGLPTGEVGANRNNAVGAWVRGLVQGKVVRRVDVRSSRRASSHGAALVVWKKL